MGEKDMKKRLEAELKRLEAMTEEQRKIEIARRDIESILNLKCPKCKAVFLDFEGCMSVRCGRIGCGISFCGWCQKDCGNNAHAHAAECNAPAEAGEIGGLYGEKDVWMRVQKKRHQRAVTDYILKLPEHIRSRVALACRQILLDAGISDVHEQFVDTVADHDPWADF